VILDEWDCIFREKRWDAGTQTDYLAFLRTLLKDNAYVKMAYMTEILPIKNMEYTQRLICLTSFP